MNRIDTTEITVTDTAFAGRRHCLENCAVRPPSDAEAASLGAFCAGIDPYRRLGLTAKGLTNYLTRPDPALFRFAIETKSQGVIGVVAIRTPWLRGPFLEMLALMPEARGRGLGREVIDWISRQSSLLAANLWTTVSDFNQTARNFYDRQGFVEVSELKGLISDDASEVLLRRRLRQ